MVVKLRPHQVPVVYDKLHNGCILYGGVGVGKTITSLAYYFARVCDGEINKWGSMKTPKDVYVITTAKVRDSQAFERQAAQFGVNTDPTISTNGVKITVDSWNNLKKYTEVKDAFFIFDEQRVVGYGAWARAFIKIARANEWILLSATPGDTWMDYIPVFIANGWYKHKTDFVDTHVIWTPRVKYPKVLRYQDVGTLVRHRNNVLVHMPYERHTVRHPITIECDYDLDLFDKAVKKRWHVFEDRPMRDPAELFSVMRRVVNSDSSRLTAVRNLLQSHPKLIVFYNFDYELEMLRELGRAMAETPTSASQKGATAKPASDWDYLLSPEGMGSSIEKQSNGSSTKSPKANEPSTQHDDSWDYLLSTEGMAANAQLGSTPTSPSLPESQSTSPSLSEKDALSVEHLSSNSRTSSPSTSGSTPTSTTPPGQCDQSCQGHWTVDRGNGERFLTCSQWNQAVSASRAQMSSATLSSENSTSSSQSGSETGSSSTGKSFSVAEWNGHKHQEIPKTDSWLYLVQYRAGAEGWNCIETDAMCFFSQTYSYRDWWQAHGRIDRLNTPFTHLRYYYLVSSSIIDKAIKKALKAKKSFNERDLELPAA